jgi:hypothetical protein
MDDLINTLKEILIIARDPLIDDDEKVELIDDVAQMALKNVQEPAP